MGRSTRSVLVKRMIPVFGAVILMVGNTGLAGVWTPIDFPSAVSTHAFVINGGNIVGDYEDASGNYHGFLYDGTAWTTLNAPGVTEAYGIDSSYIVGRAYLPAMGTYYGYVTDRVWSNLFNIPGASSTQFYAIDGVNIVGTSRHVGGYDRGLLLDGIAGTLTTLDYPTGAMGTIAFGVDGTNVVGGHVDDFWEYEHGFLYNGTTWTTLDFPGAMETEADGIDGSAIVGYYRDASWNGSGFLYDETTWTTVEYPSADHTLLWGIGGNRLIGTYWLNGVNHGFVYEFDPVTITAMGAMILASIGMILIGSLRWRRGLSLYLHGWLAFSRGRRHRPQV